MQTKRSRGGIRVFAGPGFSRRPILQQMQMAVPELTIITTPEQQIPGAPTLEIPSFKRHGYENGLRLLAAMIEENEIDAVWFQNLAIHDLSPLRQLRQGKLQVHVAGTPERLALLNSKSEFYAELEDDPACPYAFKVVGPRQVRRGFRHMRRKGLEPCTKPDEGVYGWGYWHGSEDENDSLIFGDVNRRRIHPKTFVYDLRRDRKRRNTPQVMMQVLPGLETSIDIVCWRGRPLIHAARTKTGEHTRIISADHPMVPHAYGLVERFGLHGIINVQYKQDENHVDRILEINARPAGGCLHSEAVGFKIITAWAYLVAEADPDDIKGMQYYKRHKVELDRVVRIVG